MREWADVYVPDLSERLGLEAKALFFIPMALERCAGADLSVAKLSAISATSPSGGDGRRKAGRAAIARVLKFKPVVYASALGFLEVANRALEERGGEPLVRKDIVACVFRLKDPGEVVAELGVSAQDIADGCDLSDDVVAAALARYRIQYNDAYVIWKFLSELKEDSRRTPGEVATERLTADIREFIRTDLRPPLAVKQVEDDEYVYNWRNLRAAPSSGHPWFIAEE